MGEDSDEHQLVEGHGGLVTAAEAEHAGWSRSRLRWAVGAGHLIRLRQGVYTSAWRWGRSDLRSKNRLLLLAHQRVDPRLIGYGLSAAAALGLPLPVEVASALLVRRPDLRLRGTRERAIKLHGGPRLPVVEQVVVECAQVLPLAWGLAVADAAVASGFTTQERLRSADVARGSRGARSARWVLDHVQDKVESPLESLARAVIILGGFEEPKPQQSIRTRLGIYRVDLLDERNRVITEADGKVKYGDEAKDKYQAKGTYQAKDTYRAGGNDEDDDHRNPLWREKTREDALRDEDYEVVRFTMADYYRQPAWLRRYTQAQTRARRRAGRADRRE